MDVFLNERPRNKDVKNILYLQVLFFFLFVISYIINNHEIYSFFLNFTEPILPCIIARKNAKLKETNHSLRNLSVISQKKNGLQRWKDNSVSYGQRWIAETVFSCIKRTFSEYVYSVRLENMVKEMMLKASLYNKFLHLTKSIAIFLSEKY